MHEISGKIQGSKVHPGGVEAVDVGPLAQASHGANAAATSTKSRRSRCEEKRLRIAAVSKVSMWVRLRRPSRLEAGCSRRNIMWKAYRCCLEAVDVGLIAKVPHGAKSASALKKKAEKRSAHRCRVEAVDVGPVAQVADCAKGAEQAAAQRSWKNDEAGRQEVEDAQLAGLRQHSGIWASQKQKGVEKQGCLENSRAGRRPPSSTICQG